MSSEPDPFDSFKRLFQTLKPDMTTPKASAPAPREEKLKAVRIATMTIEAMTATKDNGVKVAIPEFFKGSQKDTR
uniref:Uncharacterized protein n=1 Tax=Moniliophthora roreri TaxID=221103 RepID=A0A0W0FAW2_MONRR